MADRTRCGFDVDEELGRRFRAACALRGRAQREVLEELVQGYAAEVLGEPAAKRPAAERRRRTPPATPTADEVVDGMSTDQLRHLVEELVGSGVAGREIERRAGLGAVAVSRFLTQGKGNTGTRRRIQAAAVAIAAEREAAAANGETVATEPAGIGA